MASFPAAVASFSTKTDLVNDVDAADVNNLQNEVVALESTLGTAPNLSTTPSSTGTFGKTAQTFATVAARLANIETGIVADAHTQYVHKTGDTINIPGPGYSGLTINGASGQAAAIVVINSLGSTVSINADTSISGTRASFTSNSATQPTVRVQATAGQTSAMTEWRSSSGSVAAAVDESGNFSAQGMTATSANVTGNLAVAGAASFGGTVSFGTLNANHYQSIPTTVAFHLNGAITSTGGRVPKFIAPLAMSTAGGYMYLSAGSGTVLNLLKNGAVVATSPALSAVTSTAWTFPTLAVNAGDTLALAVAVTGTGASDLSVTFLAQFV